VKSFGAGGCACGAMVLTYGVFAENGRSAPAFRTCPISRSSRNRARSTPSWAMTLSMASSHSRVSTGSASLILGTCSLLGGERRSAGVFHRQGKMKAHAPRSGEFWTIGEKRPSRRRVGQLALLQTFRGVVALFQIGHVACSVGRTDGGPPPAKPQGVVHDPLDRRCAGRLCPDLVRRPRRGGRQGR